MLEQKTLVIPAVSFANVPQLCLDLVIHTLKLPLEEVLSARYLVPFAAAREDGREGVLTPLEVYEKENLTVVLQRSPPLHGAGRRLISNVLIPFIQKGKYDQLIFLTSSDKAFQLDPAADPFVLYSSPSSLSERFASLSVASSQTLPPLHWAGFTKTFLALAKEAHIDVTVLVMYIFEGDNRIDAHAYADTLSRLLRLEHPPWTAPPSWDLVYGEEKKRYEGATLY